MKWVQIVDGPIPNGKWKVIDSRISGELKAELGYATKAEEQVSKMNYTFFHYRDKNTIRHIDGKISTNYLMENSPPGFRTVRSWVAGAGKCHGPPQICGNSWFGVSTVLHRHLIDARFRKQRNR